MLRTGGSSSSISRLHPKPVGTALATAGRPSISRERGFELNAYRPHRATIATQEQTRSPGPRSPTPREDGRGSKLAAHQYERSCAAVPQSMVVLLAGALLALAASPTSPLSADQQPTPSASAIAPAGPWSDQVLEAARRFAVPEPWIRAVMQVESAGEAHATSPKGARGLMQIMPGTWNELRTKHDLGNDPYLPRDNILAGAA